METGRAEAKGGGGRREAGRDSSICADGWVVDVKAELKPET